MSQTSLCGASHSTLLMTIAQKSHADLRTLQQLIAYDTQHLVQSLSLSIQEARLEVHVLLSATLDVPRSYLLARENESADLFDNASYRAFLARRMQGEPIAYIVGHREFYGLNFMTTPAVLIPRPETEVLVEQALVHIPVAGDYNILDLGTGSGAIAIALAKQRSNINVFATDRSLDALYIAKQNARNLEAHNLCFIRSDWFAGINTKFDMIVSNPPYVATGHPCLMQGDLRFEPTSALTAGNDGLHCIRHIITHAAGYLKPSGWLILEHGYDQADTCAQLFESNGFINIFCETDLAGIERISGAQLDPLQRND